MAEQDNTRFDDHNIVHCLKCHIAQRNISVHLKRVCMKNNTPEERSTERQKMKLSAHKWNCSDKIWDYRFLCKTVLDKPSLRRLLDEFHQRGIVVNNVPHELERVWTYGADAAASPFDTANASTPSGD